MQSVNQIDGPTREESIALCLGVMAVKKVNPPKDGECVVGLCQLVSASASEPLLSDIFPGCT